MIPTWAGAELDEVLPDPVDQGLVAALVEQVDQARPLGVRESAQHRAQSAQTGLAARAARKGRTTP